MHYFLKTSPALHVKRSLAGSGPAPVYFMCVSAMSSQRLLGRPLLALSQCAGDGNLDEKLVIPAAASPLLCPQSTTCSSV